MGFRLFVSHSTPEADLPRLTALVAAIEAAAGDTELDVIYNLDVMYDKEQLAPGDDWRQRIAFMLHACHAAIVILDENARKSDWVLTEAIFLSLRNQVDPDFQFIPVNFLPKDDGTADALDARAARAAERAKFGEGTWRVVDLSRIQQARGATEQQVADLVVGALTSKGALIPYQSPVDRLALQLASSFGGVAGGLLDPVIDRFGPDLSYLQGERATRAAMAITRHIVGKGKLNEIRDALDLLGLAVSDDGRFAILEALAPLRLDANAAALLTRKRANGKGCVHASLQTTRPDRTVHWYIARANLAGRPKVMQINNADASFDSLQADLRTAWKMQNRRLGNPTDADADDQLRSTPRYVTVPGTIGDDVLARLDAAYPAISFVMFDSRGIEGPLPPNIVELVPRLDADREEEIIHDYVSAIDSLG